MANTSPKVLTTAFTMRVDQQFLDDLEELRAMMRPVPSKSDVLRDLVKAEIARRRAPVVREKHK